MQIMERLLVQVGHGVSMKKMRRNRRDGVPATAAKGKRVTIEFPESLLEATEHAAVELDTNRSSLVCEAVQRFLGELHGQKLEKELTEGYIANAASARVVADEMTGAETDFS
jgi:metal-responsive CopG/Arc/MetJ family transcriptional regulator